MEAKLDGLACAQEQSHLGNGINHCHKGESVSQTSQPHVERTRKTTTIVKTNDVFLDLLLNFVILIS